MLIYFIKEYFGLKTSRHLEWYGITYTPIRNISRVQIMTQFSDFDEKRDLNLKFLCALDTI